MNIKAPILPVPPGLSKDSEAYFCGLVRMADQQYDVLEADGALFEAAARAHHYMRAFDKMATDAESAGDLKGMKSAMREAKSCFRELRGSLTALKLSPDERSGRASKAAAAEERDDGDWGDLLA